MGPAILYMSLACISTTLMGVCVKQLSEIPMIQILMFRSVINLFILLVVIHKKKLSIVGKKENLKLLFCRGIFGTIGLSLYFLTFHHMPLANAVTLQNLSPIFTLIVAWQLGEKIFQAQWLLILCAFFGVCLFYGAGLQSPDWYMVLGIVSAFLSGCTYNTIRQLKGKEAPEVIMLYFPVVTIPVILIPTISYWVNPDLSQLLLLLSVGFTTFLGQYFLTRAFQSADASKVAPFTYLGVVIAVFVGQVFYNEEIGLTSLCGVAITITSLILLSRVKDNSGMVLFKKKISRT